MINKELVAASTEPLILSLLASGEICGYVLIQDVKRLSEDKIKWTDGMLYAVLEALLPIQLCYRQRVVGQIL